MKLTSAMKFPDYVYEEYPKWVHLAPGVSMRAEDAEEEARIIAEYKPEKEAEKPANALTSEVKTPDALEEFRAQATDLGIKVDGRWSEKRLQEEIEKHK